MEKPLLNQQKLRARDRVLPPWVQFIGDAHVMGTSLWSRPLLAEEVQFCTEGWVQKAGRDWNCSCEHMTFTFVYVMLFVHYALLCMSCSLYTTLFYVCHALCTLSLCTHCSSEPQLFTVEQWQTLLKYFDEYTPAKLN